MPLNKQRKKKFVIKFISNSNSPTQTLAQSAGYGEYSDFICRAVRNPNESPRYDTKQSDGEALIMLELWEMWCTSSLPLLSLVRVFYQVGWSC